MTTGKSDKVKKVLRKTIVCMSLSSFYFAMLAWPFGLTEQGYVLTRAILAGLVMFAISSPVWVINIKRELAREETAEETTVVEEKVTQTIGQLAMENKWLSPSEVRQIIFCQKSEGGNFGQVAVKRNYLTLSQVKALMNMQANSSNVHASGATH